VGDAVVQRLSVQERLRRHDCGELDKHRPALDAMVGHTEGGVVGLVQAIQRSFGYVPADVLEYVCAKAGISVSDAYGVITFYPSLSLQPRGRHLVRVCTGTACHVRGADKLTAAVADHMGIDDGGTTEDMQFTLETVACVGCCSLAPVVMVGDDTFGRLEAEDAVDVVRAFEHPGEAAPPPAAGRASRGSGGVRHPHHVEAIDSARCTVTIGLGTCGLAAGGRRVHQALDVALEERFLDARIVTTGCNGMCFREVLVELDSPELGSCLYGNVTPERVDELVKAHFVEQRVIDDLLVARDGVHRDDAAFVDRQTRIVLKNAGVIDPESLNAYVSGGGYEGLYRALTEMRPEEVIDEIDASGLRGRGGAGFPTGRKWRLANAASGPTKYVICNADEGDPGAFMDRNIIESDPFAVLEGLTIAGYATGASEGLFYVREEYPLAVERIEQAIDTARSAGFLGRGIEGSAFDFDARVVRGAGAFVCGEETALIASIEGRRGAPRPRPPYPVEEGLWGQPTSINNVETLANVRWILTSGASQFRQLGVPDSRGTKVFSLAGDVVRGGMVEVPMGITIREVIEDIGGGSGSGRPIKAVQIGGPSGGCLPSSMFDTPIDYESLAHTGAIMGSGGMVVMDTRSCMVDIARYFVKFTQRESCGKCTFCRIGTKRMLEILERICDGRGHRGDLELLEVLGEQVSVASLCGLGKTAPNPVLTTLRHFRDEYEAHVVDKRCPAGRCRALTRFEIDPHVCEGCTVCKSSCTATAIWRPKGSISLRIDAERCLQCAGCEDVCKFGAVRVV